MKREDILSDHRHQPLIPDPNNQVLWWKAMRDRFDSRHAHRSYLSSPRSEDVVTWTVFRTLEQSAEFAVLSRIFASGELVSLDLLYWLFHAVKHASPEQTSLWELLREVDGQMGGQVTEPDIVVFGPHTTCFVEAKLGEPGKKPTLWASAEARRAALYFDYLDRENVQLFARLPSDGEVQEYYQLLRNVFYSWALARKLRRKPKVVCLLNERNIDAPTRTIRESFKDFRSLLLADQRAAFPADALSLLTWQDLAAALGAGTAAEQQVAEFLQAHPCLQ